MKRHNLFRWGLLIAANALFLCMLSFNQASSAAPEAAPRKLDLADRQRAEMIVQLREINVHLKALLTQRITEALPADATPVPQP